MVETSRRAFIGGLLATTAVPAFKPPWQAQWMAAALLELKPMVIPQRSVTLVYSNPEFTPIEFTGFEVVYPPVV